MMITNIYSINDVNSTNIIINSIINSVSTSSNITSFKDNNINKKNSIINNTNNHIIIANLVISPRKILRKC
jgi:hypothetical protein